MAPKSGSSRSSATTFASPRRSRSRCSTRSARPRSAPAILAVMNEAVARRPRYLEAEACFVQRGKGGEAIEPGAGFVGMAFRHRMSRAGDPALHVHVVISNLTRAASDGKWLSLASPKGRSPLWPHGKSAGVVFQAALRAEFLREFGLECEAVATATPTSPGIGRPVIDALQHPLAGDRRGWPRNTASTASPPPRPPPTGPATRRTTASMKTTAGASGSSRPSPSGSPPRASARWLPTLALASRARSATPTLTRPSRDWRTRPRTSTAAPSCGRSAISSPRAPTFRRSRRPSIGCLQPIGSSACTHPTTRSTSTTTRRRASPSLSAASSTARSAASMPGSPKGHPRDRRRRP